MRALVFDAEAGTGSAQWGRYDWTLLRDSSVYRYTDSDGLLTAGERLGGLGYLVHRLDGWAWRDPADAHAGLAEALSFPPHYGANLDALSDALGDVAEYAHGADPGTTGTVLLIEGFRRLVENDSRFAEGMLDCFARAARVGLLLGHPMLCLVECDRELREVGATPVALAPGA
jgi:hypothetical protein